MGQMWHAIVGWWSMLTGLMSSGSIYCVAGVGQKSQNIANGPYFHISGGSCAYPLYQSGPTLARNSRPTVYAYMANLI